MDLLLGERRGRRRWLSAIAGTSESYRLTRLVRVMMVLGMLSASPPTSCLSTCVVRGDDGKDVVALSGVPTGVGR